MAERRPGLRPLHLMQSSKTPKKKKTNAESCQEYRQRLQADPARLADFKETKLQAQKRWLLSRTEEQIQRDRENSKLRKRKQRALKAQKKHDKTTSVESCSRPLTNSKPLTRKEKMKIEDKKVKQNQRQQKRRASMTPRQKEKEREKNRLRYHQKKQLLNSLPNTDQKIKRKPDRKILKEMYDKLKQRRDRGSLGNLKLLTYVLWRKGVVVPGSSNKLYQRSGMKDRHVENFYEKNAINLPNKKSVSFTSLKPKAVLTKRVKDLFEDFQKKNPGYKISLATFSRRRPKHILLSGSRAFVQCLCVKCTNPMLKMEKLNQYFKEQKKIKHVDALVQATLCSNKVFNDTECINRECKDCGVKLLTSQKELESKLSEQVTWQKWQKTNVSSMDKVKKEGTLEEMITELESELKPLAKHNQTARWQRAEYQNLQNNLPQGSSVVTIDFAENYVCRHQNEIQSAHWSYRQVSIMPCVLQYACEQDGCKDIVTDYFVALSNDLQHDAAFTKHVLNDILKHLKSKSITTVYIFSDGCAAHFKSKLPFFHLMELSESHPSLKIERHFFGSGHGKSLSDSCGGVVKSCASRAVACGQTSIQSASEMHDYCKETLTLPVLKNASTSREPQHDHVLRSFHMVETSDFDRSTKSDSLQTLFGTRDIHSMKVSQDKLQVKHLSCFCLDCLYGGECKNTFAGTWKECTVLKKKRHQTAQLRERKKKKERAKERTAEENPSSETTRNSLFAQVQIAIDSAANFKELQHVCRKYKNRVDKWPITVESVDSISLDQASLPLLPDKWHEKYLPVSVDADGNCFCRTLSFLANGTQSRHAEMRIRLTLEMVMNEEFYTNFDYLQKSSSLPARDLSTVLKQMSAIHFDEAMTLKDHFHQEVMTFRKRGSYCGLWELFAAANLLGWNLLSVYPQLGPVSVQEIMNRTFQPKTPSSRTEAVMWTTTRNDMTQEHWISNHVIPLLPVTANSNSNESADTMDETGVAGETDHTPPSDAAETGVAGETDHTPPSDAAETGVAGETDHTLPSDAAPERSLKKGDWVEVVYTAGKKDMSYIGKILQVEPDDAQVTFLRDRGCYFSFPDVADVAWVKKEQIKRKLGHPTISLRDHFSFD